MKISVLTDNTPGVSTMAEFGLSFFIEFAGKKLLFDVGQTSLFLANAKLMNIDVSNVDFIALSHGHFDHGNGLEYLKGGNLICHPDCFVKRYRKSDGSFIGLKSQKQEIEHKFSLRTTKKPLQIFDGAFFLGEIPRETDFESKTTPFIFEDGSPDFVMDDSALALILNDGVFVVTGCGHSGIVNTLEHAKKVTGIHKISGIMGGFHLKENNRQTIETIRYLKENTVRHIIPSHCTALPALAEFHREFKIKQIKTGDILNF